MQRISTIGEIIIELTEIDSTNNYAMRLIDEGMAVHGTIIKTDFQTAGKGQHGNVWLAEESKNLLFSVILDTTTLGLNKQFYLNAVSCLTMCDVLMECYNLSNVNIKWPNDIYADDKKIAGILIENNLRGSQWTNAVVGIGLNVNQQFFPDLNRVTSIYNMTNSTNKISAVLKNFITYFNRYLMKLEQNENELLQAFNQNIYKLNEVVVFRKKNEQYNGIIKSINTLGEIEIETEGKIKQYKHKEIELLLS